MLLAIFSKLSKKLNLTPGPFYYLLMLLDIRSNSEDPDQTPHSPVSDLGLHCLQRPNCPNT